jgi:hypothetical protein
VKTFGSFISRLGAALIAGSLAFTPIFAVVHAAEDHRKVTVVSFGLFGGQGVFRRETSGAAEIVANRFEADPVVVRFNTKTGGDATVEALAATLQAQAKKMNGDRDILFLILTSHGSREGLAVNAGRSAETLKPSKPRSAARARPTGSTRRWSGSPCSTTPRGIKTGARR